MLARAPETRRDRLRSVRDANIFNVGTSGAVAAEPHRCRRRTRSRRPGAVDENDHALFERLAAIQPRRDPSRRRMRSSCRGWSPVGSRPGRRCSPATRGRGSTRSVARSTCATTVGRPTTDGWKRVDAETAVTAETLAGVVAVLLRTPVRPAWPVGRGRRRRDGGWGLKCANSALKALELIGRRARSAGAAGVGGRGARRPHSIVGGGRTTGEATS